MVRKILLAGLIVVSVSGVWALPASASTPTITKFKPKSATVGTAVTIKGTDLAGATQVTFNGTVATVVSDTATEIVADVPAGATTGHDGSATPVAVEGVGGTGTLAEVTGLVDNIDGGYCALLTSGEVDCWALGESGELGNGTFYALTLRERHPRRGRVNRGVRSNRNDEPDRRFQTDRRGRVRQSAILTLVSRRKVGQGEALLSSGCVLPMKRAL